tara:strand:- start:341 stop:580 length:240 start_codon:yes stop_codon:yes gene_type:complete
LTSIAAIHDTGVDGINEWITEFGATHTVLADPDRVVYDQYTISRFRPQYIVFDRDMTVIHKDDGPDAGRSAETVVEREL